MKRWMMMAASLLLCSEAAFLYAEDKVTVEAKNESVSEELDLKAVANLFGEVKNLEEFEQKLNSDSLHLCNLDLNGDGKVDYLRVIETAEGSNYHEVLIQAVLAKDIYQDIVTINVEKNNKDEMLVKLIGDVKVYGKNYEVEPVYIYRPVIYDWFWGPNWVCYSSPWYWNYWPGWYAPYPCWGYTRYWTHVYVYHYDHPRCSYHYSREARVQATQMRNYSSRSDHAVANYNSSGSKTTTSRPSYTATRSSGSYGSRSSYSSRSSNSSSSSRGYSSYTPNNYSNSSSSSSSSSYRGFSNTSYSGSRTSSYSGSGSSRGSSSSSGSGGSRGSSSYSSGGGSSYTGGSRR